MRDRCINMRQGECESERGTVRGSKSEAVTVGVSEIRLGNRSEREKIKWEVS